MYMHIWPKNSGKRQGATPKRYLGKHYEALGPVHQSMAVDVEKSFGEHSFMCIYPPACTAICVKTHRSIYIHTCKCIYISLCVHIHTHMFINDVHVSDIAQTQHV